MKKDGFWIVSVTVKWYNEIRVGNNGTGQTHSYFKRLLFGERGS